jgi:deazaflavin-dependent oxidoreductase (nitroreductase family)
MSQSSTTRASHAPGVVPLVNPIVNRLLGAGLPMGPNVILTVRGRNSGLPRSFPVALMESRGRRFIQSPYGEVNWVRNLRADPRATLQRRHGEPEAVQAVELQPEEAGPILREVLAPFQRNRLLGWFSRRFIPIRADAGDEAYAAHVRGHPMFELVPATRDKGSTQ